MALLYSTARPIVQGVNISTPLSLLGGESYRLALCQELGNENRSVLVVSMALHFQFEDGADDLTWTQREKAAFAQGFVNAVVEVWSEKFRITTDSDALRRDCRDVGVVFEFPYFLDGWYGDDNYELSVIKIAANASQISGVRYHLENAELDSEDLTPAPKGATMDQRGAVHEFGHMLGLRDEYPSDKWLANTNLSHLGDTDSVMHRGEVVRERHYAPFAGWLTAQFANTARLTSKSIVYKVAGTTDMLNALL